MMNKSGIVKMMKKQKAVIMNFQIYRHRKVMLKKQKNKKINLMNRTKKLLVNINI